LSVTRRGIYTIGRRGRGIGKAEGDHRAGCLHWHLDVIGPVKRSYGGIRMKGMGTDRMADITRLEGTPGRHRGRWLFPGTRTKPDNRLVVFGDVIFGETEFPVEGSEESFLYFVHPPRSKTGEGYPVTCFGRGIARILQRMCQNIDSSPQLMGEQAL
jgi:hypothetical protein